MQKYTELMLRELKSKLNKEREDKESGLAASMAVRGLVHSGAHVRTLLIAGNDYAQKLLDEIFASEKKVLSHEKMSLPEDYFNDLKEELTNILFPPSLRSVGNAAVSGDCLLPSLRSGREPGSQDGLALRAAAYRRNERDGYNSITNLNTFCTWRQTY